MLVHTVLFWLPENLPGEQITQFRLALESLKQIEAAEAVYVGVPAPTPDRPVIDRTYDFCLTVLLKDLAAHDAYQADPLHQKFIADYKDLWTKVQIYDAT